MNKTILKMELVEVDPDGNELHKMRTTVDVEALNDMEQYHNVVAIKEYYDLLLIKFKEEQSQSAV